MNRPLEANPAVPVLREPLLIEPGPATRPGSEPSARRLREALGDRSARVGVIGLGYVGLPLVELFASTGFPVLGFDVDPVKVARLTEGRSYIDTPR